MSGVYPDPEAMLAAVLGGLGAVVTRTATVLPAQVADGLVFRVNRIGGGDDRITDTSRCDVITYAATIAAAKAGAEQARQALTAFLPGIATSAGVIDRAGTETGPHEVSGNDPAQVRAMVATYRISARRRPV